MCLKLITDDLYDVAARLKSVNDDYALYYNTERERYEVHNRHSKHLEFIVPYDELDARTVEYALYSRVENMNRIIAEMDAHNARLEKERAKDVIERAAVEYEQERRMNEG